MEIVEQKSLDEFLLPLIKESIDFVKRILMNDNANIYEFMDRSAVEALVQQHLSGAQNRRLLIWSLLNVEQYLKEANHG